MTIKKFRQPTSIYLIFAAIVFVLLIAGPTTAQTPPDIRIHNYLNANNVQRGGRVQGVVVMEIPAGFHIHSSKPLEKFLIATKLSVEAPQGVRVGPVSYPRAVLRNLKFSKNKVSVYEGKATMRFSVSVPAGYGSDVVDVKARLRFQSCNDELCFQPQNREMTFRLNVTK
ncbi:MAG TPA: protein-disulfide reductase DsbD N-terminal domain-containing protein [Pyrinomonadaceae bacterium]|jgi:hypothetical protein